LGGDTIPFVHQDKINDALTLAIKEWKKDQESMGDDSTEQVFDSTAFIDNYKQVARGNLIEQGVQSPFTVYIGTFVKILPLKLLCQIYFKFYRITTQLLYISFWYKRFR